MDAIAAHQHGFDNVVASMGTALTPHQVSSIRRYIDRVYLALDSDAAGQLATLRGIDAMRDSFADDERPEVRPGMMVRFERTLGAEIRVVVLPHGKDPDELIRADPNAWPAALADAIPLAEYYLTQSLSQVDHSPTARAKALHDIAVPILKEIGDAAILSHYVGLTARLLGFKDTDVHSAVVRGPSRRGHREQIQPLAFERPVARDPESYLITVMLHYPQAAIANLPHLQRDDVIDARHREILDALFAANGDLEGSLAAMPEEVAEYAQSLVDATQPHEDTIPIVASREIPQAIRRLAQVRYEERMRQLQSSLQQARQAGDAEAMADTVRQMSQLAQHKVSFAPDQSPYFRDLRSDQVVSR
jgi:DNA primase